MKERTNLDQSRVALFSDCEQYRYELLIAWDKSLPLVANIGLNPSTADEFKNDPTIKRDIERAAANGFGAFLKLNLFPFRSTDPNGMKKAANPYGEWRDARLVLAAAIQKHAASQVIAAWGNHGVHLRRSDELRQAAKESGIMLWAYELNQTKEPCHPLYKSYDLKPFPYEY